MKRAIVCLALLLAVVSSVFGIGLYHSNQQSSSPDTLFLFPGQQLHFYAGVQADTVQYLEFQMVLGNYQTAWNDYQIQMSPIDAEFLIANGNYVSQQMPWLYRLAWVSNDLDSWTDGLVYNATRVLGALHSESQNGPLDLLYPAVIDISCRVSWGIGSVGWISTVSDFQRIFVVNHNRPKGDVDNSGTVDSNDVAMAMSAWNGYYGMEYGNHFYSGGINYAASDVAIPWFDSANFFLLNYWLNHPQDPLVSSLGIGQLFEYNGASYQTISPEISGQIVNILPDGNNLYAVQGRYADGRHWSQSVLIEQGQMLRFSMGATEPHCEELTRDPIQIVMPDGVTFVSAISRQLGASTSINDSAIPSTPTSINCYPNPFSVATTVKSTAPAPAKIEVFNIKGQKIQSLTNNSKSQSVVWDGRNNQNQQVPAGIYFIRATAGTQQMTSKVIKIQ